MPSLHRIAALLLAAALLSGCNRASLFHRDDLNGYLSKPLITGHGIGELEVRKTTLSQATALLGTNFTRLETQGSFSAKCVDGVCDDHFPKFTDINLDYAQYGILLGFRQLEDQPLPEAQLVLRYIYVSCVPKGSACRFTGTLDATPIHLRSTRKDVVAAIGPSDTWTGRQGIICKTSGLNVYFDSELMKISDQDPVHAFEIFSPEDFGEFQHRSI